jgi:hypothetical protein
MLRVALAVSLLLAAPAGAAAAPLSLRDDTRVTHVALAGSSVELLRDRPDGSAQLLTMPRTGGPARSLLTVRGAGRTWTSEFSLSASPTRVAAFFELRDKHDRTTEWRVYGGPPAGPLQLLRRIPANTGFEPFVVDVDGDRTLLLEIKPVGQDDAAAANDDFTRAEVFDPSFGTVPIAWASERAAPIGIAGAYAAAELAAPRRLAAVDLATGAERAAVALPQAPSTPELPGDVAADGRVVAATEAGIAVASPGVPAATLPGTLGMTSPRFAGTDVVAVRDGQPVVIAPDGSISAEPPPSSAFTELSGDATGVAWLANGCVRVAAFGTPGGGAAGADACPTTEIGLPYIASSKLRGNRVRASMKCVSAPHGRCRGTLLGRLGKRVYASGRFSVPVGKQVRVPMRVTAAGIARLKAKNEAMILDARIVHGRIGQGAGGAAELDIEVR